MIGQISRNEQGEINLERLLIPLHDRHNQIRSWCLAVPFLHSGDVPRIETDNDPYLVGLKRCIDSFWN